MNWDEEANYIESIPLNMIPANFNRDLECFYAYCEMQWKGAHKARQWQAANRINKCCEQILAENI